jgi:hypothetical protein
LTDTRHVKQAVAPRGVLIAIRYVVPGLVVLGGLLAVVLLRSAAAAEGAAAVIGAGLSTALLNLLYRVGVGGEKERDAEAAARDYYTAHGRWPDEGPTTAPTAETSERAGPSRRH